MVAPFLNADIVAEAPAADGRPAAREAPRLVAGADIARSVLVAEEVPLETLEAMTAAWRDLAAAAIEPNAFYEPGFALPAARHFPVGERPRFIVVRAPGGRLMGLFPIMAPAAILGDGLIRLWLHKQAALATPLVHRAAAAQTIAVFLDWVETHSKAAGVVFSRLTQDGRFHAALRQAAGGAGRRMEILLSYERAALLPGGDADALCARAGSTKRLAEIRRQSRRLSEMGEIALVTHADEAGIKAATEEFLALESAGWKAGRGALLGDPALAAFLRSATRLLARDGGLRIQSLRLDGRPIAMAIVLESQGRSYYWKIAFDERLRDKGPGVQLLYARTKEDLGRPDLEMADSCAIADHPLIGRLWPDRLAVCDVAVALHPGRPQDFLARCRRETARRKLRDAAKRAANRLLKRKVS